MCAPSLKLSSDTRDRPVLPLEAVVELLPKELGALREIMGLASQSPLEGLENRPLNFGHRLAMLPHLRGDYACGDGLMNELQPLLLKGASSNDRSRLVERREGDRDQSPMMRPSQPAARRADPTLKGQR